MMPETVQQRIRRAREAQGWSQSECGRRLPEPVSHAAVCQVETGVTHLTLDKVMDYARTLDVSVSWLLAPILEDAPAP